MLERKYGTLWYKPKKGCFALSYEILHVIWTYYSDKMLKTLTVRVGMNPKKASNLLRDTVQSGMEEKKETWTRRVTVQNGMNIKKASCSKENTVHFGISLLFTPVNFLLMKTIIF